MGEEVEEVERQPRGGEGKNCLGRRRETLRGAIVEARELWPKGIEKIVIITSIQYNIRQYDSIVHVCISAYH